MIGLCLPGRLNIVVIINSADLLDDIFVKYNAIATKNEEDRRMLCILGRDNIIFMDTFHKDYATKRKVLSAAFFKQKLDAITKIIKTEAIDVIKQCQSKGEHVVDIVNFWGEIQSRIFTSIAVGSNNANVLCTYEKADGTFEHHYFGQMVKHLIKDTMIRARSPFFGLFPELLPYKIFSSCRRTMRNIQSVRDGLRKIIDARKSG